MSSHNKKQIITIAGRPGSGKSTAAVLLAARLGFKHFSSGDLYRELAQERGVELLQANISAKAHQVLDPLVDGRLRELGATADKLVIDSRTAWHWIPNSFKVFLDLNLQTAANRILSEGHEHRLKNEDVAQDPGRYAQVLKHRLEVESKRYRSKYGIDPFDKDNYDLVIDTASHDAAGVVELVLQGFRGWLKTEFSTLDT